MSFWEGFNKYVGIQGLLALIMGLVLVYATVTGMSLDESFKTYFTFVLGYYFAKNGVGITDVILNKTTKE